MEGIVQGVVTRLKEDGKVSTMVHITGVDFTEYDQEADLCAGKGVEQIYLAKKVDCRPGDKVDIVYRPGFQGKATVDKIIILEKKK